MNAEKGLIEIEGASFLEDNMSFYAPILEWVNEYINDPKDTTVNIELSYFNSSAAKLLLTIFKTIGVIRKKNFQLTVNWKYSEDDEDIRDSGLDFAKLSRIPFNMIEKDIPTTSKN